MYVIQHDQIQEEAHCIFFFCVVMVFLNVFIKTKYSIASWTQIVFLWDFCKLVHNLQDLSLLISFGRWICYLFAVGHYIEANSVLILLILRP